MSLIDTQRSIEYMYDKARISKIIEKDIDSTPEIVEKINHCITALNSIYLMGPHFNQKGIYLAEITTQDFRRAIYRVLEVVMPQADGCTFSALVGQTASVIKTNSITDSFKIISSVISYMYFIGLVRLVRAGDARSGMMEIVPTYICDKRISAYIKQSMYLPPMVCAPRILIKNTDSGYLTKEHDSVILKSYNHHNDDVCLDTLNTFNHVAYSLDIRMLTTFDEQPKKVIDNHEKQLQFNKFREDSYAVFKLLIQSGNDFHSTHKVDKRGRTYCQGYHCSSQGNSFRKSILNLAKKELVNGSFD